MQENTYQQTKPTLIANRFLHDGKERIRIRVDGFDKEYVPRIKSVPGCFYDAAVKCWHFAYTKEHWAKFKAVFAGYVILVEKEAEMPSVSEVVEVEGILTEKAQPENVSTDPQINLKVFPDPSSVEYIYMICPRELVEEFAPIIRNIHGRKWDKERVAWRLPNTKQSIRAIHALFPSERLEWKIKPNDNLPEQLMAPPAQYTQKEAKRVILQ